jgi:hypothetical protein
VTTLLDGNVLIALTHDTHIHYRQARLWFERMDDAFATCPITQGTLLRYVFRRTPNPRAAEAALAEITSRPRHEFWPDSIPYVDVRMQGVFGHRQVTDAYLAQLARYHGGRLATFDEGLAAQHRDVAELIPVLP